MEGDGVETQDHGCAAAKPEGGMKEQQGNGKRSRDLERNRDSSRDEHRRYAPNTRRTGNNMRSRGYRASASPEPKTWKQGGAAGPESRGTGGGKSQPANRDSNSDGGFADADEGMKMMLQPVFDVNVDVEAMPHRSSAPSPSSSASSPASPGAQSILDLCVHRSSRAANSFTTSLSLICEGETCETKGRATSSRVGRIVVMSAKSIIENYEIGGSISRLPPLFENAAKERSATRQRRSAEICADLCANAVLKRRGARREGWLCTADPAITDRRCGLPHDDFSTFLVAVYSRLIFPEHLLGSLVKTARADSLRNVGGMPGTAICLMPEPSVSIKYSSVATSVVYKLRVAGQSLQEIVTQA
ncbi:hypothetical protein C8R45DRAFT_1184369 [Mycena sanguinolenta]|nr:hypothetical protein C8R45DRAFT_1184369 [Mycena sanguinolenta]